jgi:predicted outer membrane protein
MTTFPFRNHVAGLMCVGLLGFTASCNRSERSQPTAPPAQPTEAVTPSANNPGTIANNPGTPNPGTPSATTPPAAEPMGVTMELAGDQKEAARQALSDVREVNALEIAAGKLAQERAGSEEVKAFGRELVVDHQTADRKVVEFATKQDLTLTGSAPVGRGEEMTAPPPVALDAEAKQKLAKLRAQKGAKFDRDFAAAMTKGHKETLALLNTAKDKVNNDGFDSLLTDIQASVERHLDHAQKLQESTAGQSAVPSGERAVQGRRPPPTPPPSDPRPTTDPMDPTRVPDPTQVPPDPTRTPDPTEIPDPTRTPTPNPMPAPTPVP